MNQQPKRRQYLLSILIVLFVGSICFMLSGVLGYRVIALILLLTVSILAITFDIIPVLIAAALSALIWDFFFIPPRFAIHVDTTEDLILLIMYFVIAMINGVLTYKIKQLEKRARIKEERANSVALYNTVLDSLSHELRTPIAAIIGATDNLQTNVGLSAENKSQLISEISKASLRLNQQVENLLNISRLESGHIKPKEDWCDVVELVYEVVKRVEDNNITREINISINQGMPLCSIDRGMLDQILYNILNNAAIHTNQRSKIDIACYCHGDVLEFTIDDSGNDNNESSFEDVLEKFTRGNDRSSSRSGLGLSIVKGFTEALRGEVQVKESLLGGSSFQLSFPAKTSYSTYDE